LSLKPTDREELKMPKFTANLNFLFSELDFMERIPAAAKAGFKAVEFPPPYKGGDEQKKIVDLIGENGLQVVLINGPAKVGNVGGRGIACLPGEREAFQESVGIALDYARALNTKRVHVQSGTMPTNGYFDRCLTSYIENVRWAADKMGEHDIAVCLEPINNKDNPGYFMHDPHLAWRIVQEESHPHLKLQFDFYHWQMMCGNLASDFKAAMPLVGHIQIADCPGRNEPGTGEINYTFLFDWIDACGWDGWVGSEYKPSSGKTDESLGWLKPYL
jgi:hydroxypyruvate isomerase